MKQWTSCHPVPSFLYFTAVIGSTMFVLHPICTPISLFFALFTVAHYCPRRALLQSLTLAAALPPLAACFNALFSHAGVTILGYLPSGNPLTLESVIYGAFAGSMLAAVLIWFTAFHVVMTSDKLLWLFSRLAPSLSLLLSMALRFVPRFRAQFAETMVAQHAIGQHADGHFIRRVRLGASVLSAMTARTLEDSVNTADAMRARGYGIGARTAFSVFRMCTTDFVFLFAVLATAACFFIWSAMGVLRASFYPVFTVSYASGSLSAYAFYALLCALPAVFGFSEVRVWR